ncbi:MAG: hypothetical protein GX986_07975, partial [Firmicutes bacterium]|nr:hypothetical protein [Bacillota bacterium]
MFPDSFIVLSVIAFVLGLLNSAGIGARFYLPRHRAIDPRILDFSVALIPVMIARLGVGSGMSVVLTGFASLMGFQLAQWTNPRYSLQRYTPIVITLAFLSPVTLAIVMGVWISLDRLGISYSLGVLVTGIALMPVIWLLHHRDLYVLFGLACLVVILYNEIPYLKWREPRPRVAHH